MQLLLDPPRQPAGLPPAEPPLTTALLVKSASGTTVRFEGDASPLTKSENINVVSAKDDEVLLTARLKSSLIYVEIKAENMPLAVLDTSEAVFQKNTLRLSLRKVVIHRVIGESRGATGPPSAWVSRTADGTCNVEMQERSTEAGSVAFRVLTSSARDDSDCGSIETIVDAKGQVVARGEAAGASRKALWVREGCDMAFLACVAIAVYKLA